MAFIIDVVRAMEIAVFTMCWCFVALWGVEKLFPRGEGPSLPEMRRAFKFWIVFAVAAGLFLGGWAAFRKWLAMPPLLNVTDKIEDLPSWALLIVGPLSFLVAYDFFNYWMHRAQHKWFWKQHRVHHSITHLSALNSFFHPTEHLFRIMAIYVPLTYVFGWDAAGATVAGAILTTAHGFYVHSPIRFNFGSAGRQVFVDNSFHRVHHSVESGHFDKNFGAFTTIWDRIFGTAHFPAAGEWPDTGVRDFTEPETLAAYCLLRTPAGKGRGAEIRDTP